MIYQNYEIYKLVKNHDNSRLIKIDFAKWFQIFPLRSLDQISVS